MAFAPRKSTLGDKGSFWRHGIKNFNFGPNFVKYSFNLVCNVKNNERRLRSHNALAEFKLLAKLTKMTPQRDG